MTLRTAALFDMDKTLVPVNTGSLYVKWRYRRNEARKRDMLRFAAWMAQYAAGVLDPVELSEKGLRALAGVDEAQFRRECLQWYREEVAHLVTHAARREVELRRDQGHVLAVLSASTEYVTGPLAASLGIEHVLCTTLGVDSAGLFTGDASLCYGETKLARATAWASEHGIDLARSSFYTDSVSDLPVLNAVGEPRVVNPDPRLRLRAALQGWPIDIWR
ncbi:MAG: HAD-IB family hydrolase [Sandaracinaceae bacterium]|nr:HAD-IB family hydrolase [Sandaracinaceae bacterium]MBK7150898.1 HAD-IB family hydrolase [Sandaracinaceae bacterium]MBK7773023.1 HAD-IB family hydrolase [Sandaracinaceae bacterium]MBK8407233.1 HAD-IB family hydrolase [Sandaracinaceae bacterium]MBK8588687.1 HAD-IB family hydrolase [Sandaracinaceae bacterium]